MKRKTILNGSFDPVTTEETLDWAIRLIKSGGRGYVCTVNVAILMMMSADSRLQNFIEKASLIVADGKPIVWASRWLSQALPERVTGIDLIDSLAARAEKEQFSIYLLGATQQAIAIAAANLKSRYPKLNICGFNDGYFSAAETAERVQAIRQSKAQILIVGMGVPRQEFFLEENWSDLGVNFAIGVGGSFDVIAGKKKRAPLWMQQAGLEWLYRLIQEPKRLWKRYLVTNVKFVCCLFSSIFWQKLTSFRLFWQKLLSLCLPNLLN
ncbi:MAG: WecB/TagA/CpsF family glycosyltransferase [Xenococcus sp. (in: cyanobacteria)]